MTVGIVLRLKNFSSDCPEMEIIAIPPEKLTRNEYISLVNRTMRYTMCRDNPTRWDLERDLELRGFSIPKLQVAYTLDCGSDNIQLPGPARGFGKGKWTYL